MAIVSTKGTAEPFDSDGQPYSPFRALTPGLHGFRLTFPWGRDREIGLIQVLAGGQADDLTEPAGMAPGPANVPDGRLQVGLQDANPSGEEFAYSVSHSLVNLPGAKRYQIRDVGCVGACDRKLPSSIFRSAHGVQSGPFVIALVGFKLFFTGGRDREIDRIGVWFTGDELHVALRDQSASNRETFGYLVDFVVIPKFGLNVSSGIARGTARAFDSFALNTPSRAHFMLTGWAFNFRPGDREIHDIGVLRSRNSVIVFYADNGGGEEFDWRVEYVHIAPEVFAGRG